ncbi:hypothetical protein BDV93DRAFT_73900 [Ceratobasidium sp. AG-I]|nr:hypothetical protein BDV93DRAFT_73900 [Ceratobasidium sp. AG-I]
MHRLPSRDSRAKPKPSTSPICASRPRASSNLSLLQPSQLHARASSVVRKVLGTRVPLKDSSVFVGPARRASCDKPRTSADSAGTPELVRPRRNTTICSTENTEPKPTSASPAYNDTFSTLPSASSTTFQLHLPLHSLLFSPNSPTFDETQPSMQSPTTSANERPTIPKGSPEMYDSGYASSAAGSALPTVGPSAAAPKTPRMVGRTMQIPLTPGSMRMSPSVTRTMMPMPILNLPALPPTPSQSHTLPRTRSFQPGEMRHVKKAMPALMRHGTSNMHLEHPEEDDDDDDDGSTDGSDSSETEEATPADEHSSPDTRDSIDESTEESIAESSTEGDYFDAREAHTPAPTEDIAAQQSIPGLVTPRASQRNRPLPNRPLPERPIPAETSALGLQITPGLPTITGSPWTVVDATTPGADRPAAQQSSRLDYFSHPVATVRQAFKSPHKTPRVSQLPGLGSSSRINVTTPRVTASEVPRMSSIATRRARAATVLRSTDAESSRPALYQQMSHSMMNLSSPPVEDMSLGPFGSLRSPLLTPRQGMSTIAATPGTPGPPMHTPLIRRNSMPTMIKHPPAYKELFPSVPREEEGKEKLPRYSCGIHIEALMPRKMEFSAPGVMSKDRGWKKQYIVLHGTSLYVYKHDIRKQPIGGKIKGKGQERYEGVVTEDEVDLNSPTVHLPGHESCAARPPLNTVTRRTSVRSSSGDAPSNSSRSSLLSRFHGNSSRAVISTPQEPSTSDDKTSASASTASINTSASGSSRRWSHNQASGSFSSSLPHFNPPFSSPNTLVKQYTLQGSESGLGSDYYKKRNVIRVRCEGEQFLLQAENVMQVVDWIEVS